MLGSNPRAEVEACLKAGWVTDFTGKPLRNKSRQEDGWIEDADEWYARELERCKKHAPA